MSFRRAWRGGGHELFLRAFLRCADDGFTEFLLWRIPAASNGLHTDVQNAWHITARAVATNFAQYLEDVADAQQVRVRIVPSRSSGETQLCVVALPNEGQVRLGPSSTWSCARERCIDQEPRDALPDWTLPGDGVVLLDGQKMLNEMRRLRGPGRQGKIPAAARMSAYPVVNFGALGAGQENIQRIIRIERWKGDQAKPETECEDIFLPSLCSNRVPGKITWFANYDDTTRALVACQAHYDGEPFRVRMCYDDGSGWMWFSPEAFAAPYRLHCDEPAQPTFIAAVMQDRPDASAKIYEMIASLQRRSAATTKGKGR